MLKQKLFKPILTIGIILVLIITICAFVSPENPESIILREVPIQSWEFTQLKGVDLWSKVYDLYEEDIYKTNWKIDWTNMHLYSFECSLAKRENSFYIKNFDIGLIQKTENINSYRDYSVFSQSYEGEGIQLNRGNEYKELNAEKEEIIKNMPNVNVVNYISNLSYIIDKLKYDRINVAYDGVTESFNSDNVESYLIADNKVTTLKENTNFGYETIVFSVGGNVSGNMVWMHIYVKM